VNICARISGDRPFHVGLIERDLGGVDRLRLGHAVLDAGAPVLGVHRLAFPEGGNGETEIAARSSSVRSTMAKRSLAKRVQKDWQGIEQNQTEGRGRLIRC
jgi:hypothetical protein